MTRPLTNDIYLNYLYTHYRNYNIKAVFNSVLYRKEWCRVYFIQYRTDMKIVVLTQYTNDTHTGHHAESLFTLTAPTPEFGNTIYKALKLRQKTSSAGRQYTFLNYPDLALPVNM